MWYIVDIETNKWEVWKSKITHCYWSVSFVKEILVCELMACQAQGNHQEKYGLFPLLGPGGGG